MKKTIDYNTLIQLQEALRRLASSGARFPMPVAVRLSLVSSEVDRLVSDFTSALREAVPRIADAGAALGGNDMEIYTAMMASSVEIDTLGVEMPHITMDDAARLDLPTVNILMSVF